MEKWLKEKEYANKQVYYIWALPLTKLTILMRQICWGWFFILRLFLSLNMNAKEALRKLDITNFPEASIIVSNLKR